MIARCLACTHPGTQTGEKQVDFTQPKNVNTNLRAVKVVITPQTRPSLAFEKLAYLLFLQSAIRLYSESLRSFYLQS